MYLYTYVSRYVGIIRSYTTRQFSKADFSLYKYLPTYLPSYLTQFTTCLSRYYRYLGNPSTKKLVVDKLPSPDNNNSPSPNLTISSTFVFQA